MTDEDDSMLSVIKQIQLEIAELKKDMASTRKEIASLKCTNNTEDIRKKLEEQSIIIQKLIPLKSRENLESFAPKPTVDIFHNKSTTDVITRKATENLSLRSYCFDDEESIEDAVINPYFEQSKLKTLSSSSFQVFARRGSVLNGLIGNKNTDTDSSACSSPTIHTYTIYSTSKNHWTVSLPLCLFSFTLLSLQAMTLFHIMMEATFPVCSKNSDCEENYFCSNELFSVPRCMFDLYDPDSEYLLFNETSLEYTFVESNNAHTLDCTSIIKAINVEDAFLDYADITEVKCLKSYRRKKYFDETHPTCKRHTQCGYGKACGISMSKLVPHCYNPFCYYNQFYPVVANDSSMIVKVDGIENKEVDCTGVLDDVKSFDTTIIDRRNLTTTTCLESLFCNATENRILNVEDVHEECRFTSGFKVALVFLALLGVSPIISKEIEESIADEIILEKIIAKNNASGTNLMGSILGFSMFSVLRVRIYFMPFLVSIVTSSVILTEKFLVKHILSNILSIAFLLEIDNFSKDFILPPISMLEEIDPSRNADENKTSRNTLNSWLLSRFYSIVASMSLIAIVLTTTPSHLSYPYIFRAGSTFAVLSSFIKSLKNSSLGLKFFFLEILKQLLAFTLISGYFGVVYRNYCRFVILYASTISVSVIVCMYYYSTKTSLYYIVFGAIPMLLGLTYYTYFFECTFMSSFPV